MKRLIASIVASRNRVVNTYSFKEYRPCASFKHTFQRLQEWEVDELLILNRTHSTSPSYDFSTLLGTNPPFPLSTPISYGGGISNSSIDEIKELMSLGVERIVLTATSISGHREINWLEKSIGEQAIVVHLPIIFSSNSGDEYISSTIGLQKTKQIAVEFSNWGGEILITDCLMAGAHQSRHSQLLEVAEYFVNVNVSVGGGISQATEAETLFKSDSINGVYLDNYLNRMELALPKFRNQTNSNLRRGFEQ